MKAIIFAKKKKAELRAKLKRKPFQNIVRGMLTEFRFLYLFPGLFGVKAATAPAPPPTPGFVPLEEGQVGACP